MIQKIVKKIGEIMLCPLVFLMALAVMYLAQSVVMLPAYIIAGMKAGAQGITEEAALLELTAQTTMKMVPYSILATHLAFILVFGLWYRKICKDSDEKKADFRNIFRRKNLAGMICIGIGSCYALNMGMEVVLPLIPSDILESYMNLMEQAQIGVNPVSIFAATILAPIGEEFIYRGVLFHFARKVTENMKDKRVVFWIANIIQAVFFGASHLNIFQGVYAFVIGLLIGYVAYRCKSVLPAILVHLIFNVLSVLTAPILMEILSYYSNYYYVTLGVFLMMIILGVYLLNESGFPKKDKEE